MTGLDPNKHRIIEIAAIVTDFDMNELGSFEAVVHHPESVLKAADEWVQGQFEGPEGLFSQVRASEQDEDTVENALIEFVQQHFTEPIILAGSSIHQDRRFIRHGWIRFEKLLHYRMLDVSSLKVYMMGKYKRILHKPETHRALDDIRGSIAEFSLYLKELGEGVEAKESELEL